MRNFILIVAITSAMVLSACGGDKGRRDATTVGERGWVFEGWACGPLADKSMPPSQIQCKKKDHLYMKFSAAASQKAIDSGRLAQMMSTCREAALLQIKGDGLSKIIGEYLEKASGVSDGQSTGVAIVASTRGKIKGVGVYDCCAINNDTGKCTKPGKRENWEQCMCVGYMKFRGGQKSFNSAAEEVKAEE